MYQKHYFDLKFSAKSTHQVLKTCYPDSCPSERTISYRFALFKAEDCTLEDKKKCGKPKKKQR